MICPHCGKTAIIPDVVFMNLQSYGGAALSVTKCCGRGVNVRIRYEYELTKDATGAKRDAWARELKT